MSLLDTIHGPADVRALAPEKLQSLADEVRQRLIEVVSQTGGHIGAGLGVVELTVALLHEFDSPHDKIVWDVGHQGYPWKVLTGRNPQLPTLRQEGGLSGFLRRAESTTSSERVTRARPSRPPMASPPRGISAARTFRSSPWLATAR